MCLLTVFVISHSFLPWSYKSTKKLSKLKDRLWLSVCVVTIEMLLSKPQGQVKGRWLHPLHASVGPGISKCLEHGGLPCDITSPPSHHPSITQRSHHLLGSPMGVRVGPCNSPFCFVTHNSRWDPLASFTS